MTYSNINKDKRKASSWKTVKQGLFYAVMIYLIITSLKNIYGQWTTLKAAEVRLRTLNSKLAWQEKEIRKYKSLIDEATSSAILERKYREYFGIGTEKDVWLVLPTITDQDKLPEETEVISDKPNVLKWWDLFSK